MAKTAAAEPSTRDRFVALAIEQGESPSVVADHLGLSRQQVHAIADRAAPEPAAAPELQVAAESTAAALDAMTDHVGFEELVHVLLADIDPRLRPLGGTNDRGRDAAADLGDGDGSIVSISLEREWTRKIRREVDRIVRSEYSPPRVYGITNRRITRDAERKLEAYAEDLGITLRVLGQQWLVAKLTHPDHLETRKRFLGLQPPRPKVFLAIAEYRRLLRGRVQPASLETPLVGRTKDRTDVRDRLHSDGWLILQGEGGIGKTRLLMDMAEEDAGSRAWRFVDEATPIAGDALGELGGEELVVVVDNAHRRNDLDTLLGLLERREPKPQVVLVTRSRALHEIGSATSSIWLGPATDARVLTLRSLDDVEIASIAKGPPFEIEFPGMVRHIVALAEGNPLIAVLAAQLAKDGRSVPALTRDEVFAQHVSGLLDTLTDRSPDARQLRELLAIVAAIGSLDRHDDAAVATVASLLGFAERGVRRWLDDLADLGLVTAGETGLAIKPDLLAEHVLAASFFSRTWRPVLDYAEVFDAFASTRLQSLCAALGRLSHGQLDAQHADLRDLRRHLDAVVRTETIGWGAALVRDLLPGAEDLAIPLLEALIDRVAETRDSLSDGAGKALVAATQRVNWHFAASWRLLLRLAAAAAGSSTFDEASDAMKSVYQRIPSDVSKQDGAILAEAQDVLADVTATFARRATSTGDAGSLRATMAAGKALLVMLFEDSFWSTAQRNGLTLRGYALPATEQTRRVVKTGVDTIAATLLRVEPGDQLGAIQAATTLASHAGGLSGPFGITLDQPARILADGALAPLDDLLVTEFERFGLPLRAEILGYLLQRREWRPHVASEEELKSPPVAPPERSTELDDYVLLIHPHDIEPLSDRLSWEDEQRERLTRCARLAQRFAGDPEWRAQVALWERWLGEARQLFDQANGKHTVGVVLDGIAACDSALAVAVIDGLVDSRSPLRVHAAQAMRRLAQAGEAPLPRWLEADEETRATLANAIADLDDEVSKGVFRRLADDRSEAVMRGVLGGLHYGSRGAAMPWRIRLGLDVARRLADADALYEVLLIADVGGVELTAELAGAAREALLATSGRARVDVRDLVSAIALLEPVTGDLSLDWVWRRLEWLTTVTDRAWEIDPLPEELHSRVHEHATGADLMRVLDTFGSAPRSGLITEAAIRLLEWIDPGSPEVTAAIARHYEGSEDPWRARRLLGLRGLSWAECFARARFLAGRLPGDEIVSSLVHSMLPIFWSGSRMPHLEHALSEVRTWTDPPAPPEIQRAAREEIRDLEQTIEAELDTEQYRNI